LSLDSPNAVSISGIFVVCLRRLRISPSPGSALPAASPAPTRFSMDSSDGCNTSMIYAVGSALSIAAGSLSRPVIAPAQVLYKPERSPELGHFVGTSDRLPPPRVRRSRRACVQGPRCAPAIPRLCHCPARCRRARARRVRPEWRQSAAVLLVAYAHCPSFAIALAVCALIEQQKPVRAGSLHSYGEMP
jgi:hypothetical protein